MRKGEMRTRIPRAITRSVIRWLLDEGTEEGRACVPPRERKRHEEKGGRVIAVREGNGRYPMGNDAKPRINRGLRAVAAG